MDKRLLENERFIWKDVLFHAAGALERVRRMWKKDRHIPRMLFSWPSEHLPTKEGRVVTHMVSFVPPAEMDSHTAAVTLVKETKAYAIMLIEQDENEVKILVESFHGTKCWHIPITRHGDVNVLDKNSRASEDTESFGILWRRDNAATS